jgi:hypothetical protein
MSLHPHSVRSCASQHSLAVTSFARVTNIAAAPFNRATKLVMYYCNELTSGAHRTLFPPTCFPIPNPSTFEPSLVRCTLLNLAWCLPPKHRLTFKTAPSLLTTEYHQDSKMSSTRKVKASTPRYRPWAPFSSTPQLGEPSPQIESLS